MEVATCGALTAAWWASSVTVLLPFVFLLKYSKFFRDLWFSVIFMKVLKRVFEPKMTPLRKKAFELLKKNLPPRDASKSLKVLEIGIGGGANLQFYPDNCTLTALDMNVNFDKYFQQNQKKFPQIKYEKTIIAGAENMKEVADSSMDVVVSTYVLCSVSSINDVLREVKRVLKPGGKFLFLEHVSYSKSDWGYSIQKFASPLWLVYFDGCNLTRNIGDDIKNAGFSDVICEKIFPKSLMLFIRAQVYGLATK